MTNHNRVLQATRAVLLGDREQCIGAHRGAIVNVNNSDLVDLIGISDHPELIAKWFAQAYDNRDPDAVRMMDEWIEEVIDGLE